MKSLLFLAAVLIPAVVSGQSAELLRRQADEERKAGRYEPAIALYLDALKNNEHAAEAHLGLAESYRLSMQYEEAESAYRIVRNSWADQFPLSIFYYGLMLKLNGNFEAAVNEFTDFINIIGESERYPDFSEQAYVEKAGAELALYSSGADKEAVHMNSPVNTRFNDFSPEFSGDEILIVTSGRGKGWTGKRDLKYGEGFMDQHAFKKQGNKWQETDLALMKIVNGKFHDGNGTFSPDGKTYLYTSCGDVSVKCRILVVEKGSSGKWGKPRPLGYTINRTGYDAKHPAFSPGGDTLFFVSDRPGGAGGNDIWLSVSLGNNKWADPQNLRSINTSFNELSPRQLGAMLFFSSEGHQSYGGYDLYVYTLVSDTTLVVNPGKPLNSSRDDAYPEIFGNSIYWSSNRKGGLGNFDIYKLDLDDINEFFYQTIKGSPSALRADVGKLELKQMQEARKNIAQNPFAFESLTDRQKQLINEVIISKRAGRSLPSELEYLSSDEREFILKAANERMQESKED